MHVDRSISIWSPRQHMEPIEFPDFASFDSFICFGLAKKHMKLEELPSF